jgi:spore coat polysaccharide biosynthesis protein SpsF (cytidylyltransferase family)
MQRKIVAVVQARMGSARLPGKALTPLAGTPALEHVLRRTMQASTVGDVVLATTTSGADDVLCAIAHRLRVNVFRGDAKDVLARVVGAARSADADVVVRITADNPMVDPGIIDTVTQAFVKSGAEYASNTIPPTWPKGLDVEVVSLEALQVSAKEARAKDAREHVTLYIKATAGRFKLVNVVAPTEHAWPDLRLTLDTADDLKFISAIFDAFHWQAGFPPAAAVIEWVRSHPHARRLCASGHENRLDTAEETK